MIVEISDQRIDVKNAKNANLKNAKIAKNANLKNAKIADANVTDRIARVMAMVKERIEVERAITEVKEITERVIMARVIMEKVIMEKEIMVEKAITEKAIMVEKEIMEKEVEKTSTAVKVIPTGRETLVRRDMVRMLGRDTEKEIHMVRVMSEISVAWVVRVMIVMIVRVVRVMIVMVVMNAMYHLNESLVRVVKVMLLVRNEMHHLNE